MYKEIQPNSRDVVPGVGPRICSARSASDADPEQVGAEDALALAGKFIACHS